MKKKMIAAAAAAVLAAGLLAGCSGQLSNDYVTVTQYKGLEVPQPDQPDEVTEEEVQNAVQSNLDADAQNETITGRAAQNGDWVNIDYTGYLDGETFDGGSAEGAELQLGAGGYIGATEDYAGFEEQIEGHNTGDEFDITVQFPESYTPEMAGKVAQFHIVLNDIFEKVSPELTDEWVKENSETAQTAEEYRGEIRRQLEEEAEETLHSQLSASVQSALLDKTEVKKYPEDQLEEQKAEMRSYYEQMAEYNGLELEEYLMSSMNMTEEQFEEQVDEAVKQSIALDEAIKLVAEKQKLEPSEEEFEKKVAEYAAQAGMEDDVEAYKEQVGEDVLKDAILRQAVLDYLVDECIQVEQTEDSE